MLRLVSETVRKRAAQREFERNLKSALKPQGTRNIGYPGGNVDLPIYSAGAEKLWVAFSKPPADAAVRRFANSFGVYQPKQRSQLNTVLIDIPIESNTAQVAGFFAEDSDTGDVFVMHSGKLGGGRPGIGKSAFLAWSMPKLPNLIEVSDQNGAVRTGIAVARLNDPDLADRIWTFVKSVQSFKDATATGTLDTPEFKRQVEEFDRYIKEFSGRKRGSTGGIVEYLTYHGDIVQKLYDLRTLRASPGEQVFNSPLIDMFVKKNGALSEVYEVKTAVERQTLYTAIGQVVTHAANGSDEVAKFLVLPADENIPKDLERAIGILGIKVRRFRLRRAGRKRAIELD